MSESSRPPAFRASLAFGVVGVVLFLGGWVASSDAMFLSGMVAGLLSLVAALWWRSQLVAAWRARTRPEA